MIFLSAFSPVWVLNLQLSVCGHSIPLGFCICALVYNIWKNMQESSNYDSRLAVVYTDFLLFPCFYMLSFAFSDVCRELMWPWWRERDFSSPTRSSSSSELGDAAAASPRPPLFLQCKAHLRHGNICAKSNQSACESWGLGH